METGVLSQDQFPAICQPYTLANGKPAYYLHIDKEAVSKQREIMASVGANPSKDAYPTAIGEDIYNKIIQAGGSLSVDFQPKSADSIN